MASAPNTTTPLNATSFRANLAQYVNNEARRSINLFSDLVGIWSGTIRRLLLGKTKLRLEVLCQLCSRLNISPFNLLHKIDSEEVFEISHLILDRDIIFLLNKVIPWSQVEDRLRTALKEDPPPSMEAIARCMGYYPPKIKRHFPEICGQIISRYRKHLRGIHPSPKDVRRAFQLALKEQPPPSLQCVLRRLGCRDTGSYYYQNYRELCFTVSRRYRGHRNKPFSKDADAKCLQAALIEDPPPSFSAVAKRLGHKREFVHKKFPELSKAVTFRYLHYQTVLRKEKAENLRYEIRKAIQQIVASGQFVSEARVKDAVKQYLPILGRSSLFKQALCEVKLDLGLAR